MLNDTAKKITAHQLSVFRYNLYQTPDTITFSAIFISDGDKKYLVTARHCLKSSETSYGEDFISSTLSVRTSIDAYFNQHIINNSLDINEANKDTSLRAYKFSKDLDIAIISLQSNMYAGILSTILKDGYTPIPINYIDTLNNNIVSNNIIAIGFPTISILGKAEAANKNVLLFQSTDVVAPITTFGKIAMFDKRLPYFIGDITIYPGNSGGPVIADNKLIGIVSEQLSIPLDVNPLGYFSNDVQMTTRGTLARVVKAKNILPLLRELQIRERNDRFNKE